MKSHMSGRRVLASIAAIVGITVSGALVVDTLTSATVDSGDRAVLVSVSPERVLDTRTDVGLAGPFISGTPQNLQVTGSVPTATGTKTVVPDGATAVVLNVTVDQATQAGFVSIRPGNATGTPSTSNLNFETGQINPNAVTVQLPTSGGDAGEIEIWYQSYAGSGIGQTEVLVDVVGYYDHHTHDDRYLTEAETNTIINEAETEITNNVVNTVINEVGVALTPLSGTASPALGGQDIEMLYNENGFALRLVCEIDGGGSVTTNQLQIRAASPTTGGVYFDNSTGTGGISGTVASSFTGITQIGTDDTAYSLTATGTRSGQAVVYIFNLYVEFDTGTDDCTASGWIVESA